MLTPDFQPFLNLFQLFFDGIAVVVPNPWRIVFENSTLSQWAGRPAVQLEELPLEAVFAADSLPTIQSRLEQVWQDGDTPGAISANLVHSGDRTAPIPVEIRLARLAHLDQRFVGIVVRKTEASKPVVAAGRLDPLTGLADRSELLARLATLLGGDRSADQQFAVLFIDLDDFKEVNDCYGHLIGDRVLSEAAQRLVRCTRAGDQVFRYGGDEFVVLLERIGSGRDIEPVVCRIHDELAHSIAIPNGTVSLSVSVGVAAASAAHRTPEDILFDADCAMYAAKRQSSLRVPR